MIITILYTFFVVILLIILIMLYAAYGFPPDNKNGYSLKSRLELVNVFLNILARDDNEVDAVEFYNKIVKPIWNHNPLFSTKKYLNLGYWLNTDRIDDACDQMALLLGKTIDMTREDDILDVGFGYGEQDIFWNNKFKPKSIDGINITNSQVKYAKKFARERGLTNINFMEGDAMTLTNQQLSGKLKKDGYHKVVALESPFHFPNREEFFKESYNILKKNGKIGMADLIVPKHKNFISKIGNWFLQKFWQIPTTNIYDIDEYKRKLEGVGFKNIKIIDISKNVFKPLWKYNMKTLATEKSQEKFHWLHRNYMTWYIFSTLFAAGWPWIEAKYCIIVASK